MALTKDGLAEASKTAMAANPTSKDDALEAMAGVILYYIVGNLEVKVPAASFVITVTGQAVGTPNAAAVDCEIT